MAKTQEITVVRPPMDIEAAVDRCGALAAEKSAIEKEMQALRRRIAEAAEFGGACKTARVVGRQFVAKVERKEEIKYDKDGLTRALEAMGQEKFRELFDWEYVARARKPEIDAFIKHSPHGQLIEAARRVREAAPSVSFTANEGD